MNFFKKLFGKKQQEPLSVNEDVFPEAGRLLSGGDESVVRQIGYYVEHSEEYLARQDAHYRGLSNDTTKYDICLFAMIDALIEHDYMREFDWKEDQDDILHGLRVIAKKLGVSFDIEMDLGFLTMARMPSVWSRNGSLLWLQFISAISVMTLFVSISTVTAMLWDCCHIKIISAAKLCCMIWILNYILSDSHIQIKLKELLQMQKLFCYYVVIRL